MVESHDDKVVDEPGHGSPTATSEHIHHENTVELHGFTHILNTKSAVAFWIRPARYNAPRKHNTKRNVNNAFIIIVFYDDEFQLQPDFLICLCRWRLCPLRNID